LAGSLAHFLLQFLISMPSAHTRQHKQLQGVPAETSTGTEAAAYGLVAHTAAAAEGALQIHCSVCTQAAAAAAAAVKEVVAVDPTHMAQVPTENMMPDQQHLHLTAEPEQMVLPAAAGAGSAAYPIM
jgi:hypothetical protein